jgi:hypothetical protein
MISSKKNEIQVSATEGCITGLKNFYNFVPYGKKRSTVAVADYYNSTYQ